MVNFGFFIARKIASEISGIQSPCFLSFLTKLQGEDRKKWPPMKIGFLDYNCVKRAENVEKFINRTVQLPNMTEGLTLLNLKCNFHHTNR